MKLEGLESRTLLAFAAQINFEIAGAPVPTGYTADVGLAYGNRGNGLTFGWNKANTDNSRDRNAVSDQRYDTLNHMQKPGGATTWEIAVPNGNYTVHLVSGDPSYTDSVYKIDAEGTRVVDGTPTNNKLWIEGTKTVTVSDGKLTISSAPGSSNNKVSFIEIASTDTNPPPPPPPPPANVAPTVSITSPTGGTTFTPGSNIQIVANAGDSDGSVAKVEFFQNNIKIDEEVAAPYNVTLTNVSAGNYAFKAVAWDNLGAQTTSAIINVTVSGGSPNPGTQTPYLSAPVALPGLVEAENFDNGGEGVAYHDFNPSNLGNAYRSTGVDIRPGGSNNVVGWTSPGEWLEYGVNVDTAGTYLLEMRVAAGNDAGTVHVEFNGVDKTGGIRITSTGGWNTFQSLSRVVTLDAGPQIMRLAVDSGGNDASGDIDWFRISKAGDVPSSNWVAGKAAGQQRFESYGVAVGDKIYQFGGYLTINPFETTQRVDVYDPATDSWASKKTGMMAPTHAGVAYDAQRNVIYFVGGLYGNYPGDATTDVWRYNIADDSWTKMPSLPYQLSAGPSAIVDGKLHYLGANRGQDRVTDFGDHLVLDLNGGTQWTTAAPMILGRDHFATAVLDGKMYAVGGEVGHDTNHIQKTNFEVYDPATNLWASLAPLPVAESHIEASVFVRNGKIVVAGGQMDNYNSSNLILQYDPSTNKWETIGTLPNHLQGQVTQLVGTKLITTTGWENTGPLVNKTWIAVWA